MVTPLDIGGSGLIVPRLTLIPTVCVFFEGPFLEGHKEANHCFGGPTFNKPDPYPIPCLLLKIHFASQKDGEGQPEVCDL